ncbi:alpha/beta hydrolase [Aliidiomarina minuta]|uniref:Alpha/beta hydrolase n=1 Tax=Aliidiomarina minuta TaxID=880057 RepID=A0A432W5Y4_9GAMM|nr:alpha/beta fold hydrolase [Aliidiomarina minuta]RUO25389.1 alpha/beta hydrolase [Aliidiomarina minuta]
MADKDLLWNGEHQHIVVLFAHGAGAGPDSAFMQFIAQSLADNGLAVVRFDFPYWQKVRSTGIKRPPNPQPVLQDKMLEVAATLAGRPLWLMGKSMGARVAFQCVDKAKARGAVGLGFPFHPPAKVERTRTHELNNAAAANLVVQGTLDPFGKEDWVKQQQLPENLELQWIEKAKHDLVPNKSTGVSDKESWRLVATKVATFIKERS